MKCNTVTPQTTLAGLMQTLASRHAKLHAVRVDGDGEFMVHVRDARGLHFGLATSLHAAITDALDQMQSHRRTA